MSEQIRAAMQFAVRSIIGPTNETETAWLERQIDGAYAKYMAKDVPVQPPMSILELMYWCAAERGKIDAYNPRSSEEYGLRRVEIELRKLVTAQSHAAREALLPLARIGLWQDRYPDGPDVLTDYRLQGYFTPGQVRAARALSSGKPGVEGTPPQPPAKLGGGA